DIGSMQAAQLDVHSPAFAELAPLMIAAARPAATAPEDKEVLDLLSRWDASMRADTAEPLIFVAWLRESVRGIYADDLGPAFGSFFHPQAKATIRLLKRDATGRDWCDDGRPPERESWSDVLASAQRRALEDLENTFHTDPAKWSWGEAHTARGEHRAFSALPIIGRYFNVG